MNAKRPLWSIPLCLLVGSWSAAGLLAAEPKGDQTQAGVRFFEAKIRPVLVKHCYDCHSAEAGAAEGELELDSRQAIRQGGKHGPAVVPGKPQASWLLKALRHTDPELKMPPKQKPLPNAVLADFEAWIKMGAPDPRNRKPSAASRWDPEAARKFWSYQTPKQPEIPAVANRAWPKSEIDRFVLARLEAGNLAPSPDARPNVLLRRLHFDLTGLPPTVPAIRRFLQAVQRDGLDAALAEKVDELLDSPAYGERWGRHWLDVARFGESSGGEANISFPYAWRYRDYVIDCFNADVPFDRFLIEQLAGDLLPAEDKHERARLLIATGFLACGPKNLDEMNERQFQADVVDEQIDTVSRAFLASSVSCARCHDHKFDPFSMKDYYALAGLFSSTKTFFGTAVSPANRVGGDPLPLPRLEELPIFHRSIPAEKVKQLEAERAKLIQEREEGMAAVKKAVAAGKNPGQVFTLKRALAIFWRLGAIEGQLEKVDQQGQALPLAMGVLDKPEISGAPLLERGDIRRPGDVVPRGMPGVIPVPQPDMPQDQSGRLQLARWMTHPQHPLTSRVIVNRVWHHLFGSGLVRTVDNFGTTGEKPSHPELLDHLALQFVAEGWSLKKIIRRVVLSRTYRQASQYDAETFQQDPENRLLWRVSKRRLEAEAIRDAMLVASGEIELERPQGSLVGRVIGDRPISLIGLDKRLPKDLDGAVHRSVYLPVIRDRLPDVLDLFDFAEPSLVTGRREVTNVPIQALYLLNGDFVNARAEALAARLQKEARDDDQRVRRAFLLCFCRKPDAQEKALAVEFLKNHQAARGDQAAADMRLVHFCHALLCTAEFRNLD